MIGVSTQLAGERRSWGRDIARSDAFGRSLRQRPWFRIFSRARAQSVGRCRGKKDTVRTETRQRCVHCRADDGTTRGPVCLLKSGCVLAAVGRSYPSHSTAQVWLRTSKEARLTGAIRRPAHAASRRASACSGWYAPSHAAHQSRCVSEVRPAVARTPPRGSSRLRRYVSVRLMISMIMRL
jgi:hypothetical protein